MPRTSKQLGRLKRRLDAVPKQVRDAVQPALDKSADEIAARARSLAPVDDGTLRDSIVTAPGEHELAREVRAGDGPAFYGRFVEFGTPDAPAQPFLFPAYRLLKKRATGRIRRAVAKAVREGAGV